MLVTLVRELGLLDDKGTGAALRLFYLNGEGEPPPVLPPTEDELALALHSLVVIFVTRALRMRHACEGWTDPVPPGRGGRSGRAAER